MKNIILISFDSAAGLARRLFRKIAPDRGTRVIASYDDYSHGPLSKSCTSRDFILERQAFWKSFDVYDGNAGDEINLMDRQASMVSEVKSAEMTEIWIADSVQDIFFATVTLHLLTVDGVDTSDIIVRNFGGDRVKWGLGALTVEDFEEAYSFSEAKPFDPEIYSDAWEVISEGSGNAVKRFIDERDVPAPLVRALSAYLLRFPDFNGGLGSIERSLLGAGTEDMTSSAYTVGGALAKGEPGNDHLGDLILFKKLVELCQVTSDPWFMLEGDPRHMRSCSVQITESGRAARIRYSVQLL